MHLTEEVKVEEPFDEDGNNIYYINGGRCSGKVNRTVNELVEYANNLQKQNQKYKEVINKTIEYIKYCQTSDDDIFPVIEAEKMIEILKGVE